MAKCKEHRATQTIIVKKATIDKGIVILVKWLNSFEGITTMHCCEGGLYGKKDNPYVMFTCLSNARLLYLISKLQDWGWFEIDLHCNTIRYTYYANDTKALRDLQETGFIRRNK